VALNLIEHVGPVRVRQLLEHFGHAPAILRASKVQLLQVRGVGFRMNVNDINGYLQQAREIIGDRSESEIAYDDSVVAHLGRGMDIKRAIRAANQEHPEEALTPGPEHWADLAARYDYISQQGDPEDLGDERISTMMRFLADQVTDAENKTGQFEVECDGKRYVCRVALDRTSGAKQAEVTWS
jgi:hypothetical protein